MIGEFSSGPDSILWMATAGRLEEYMIENTSCFGEKGQRCIIGILQQEVLG